MNTLRLAAALMAAAMLAACGHTESGFNVAVGNRTTFPIQVFEGGTPLGNLPAGESTNFSLSATPTGQANRSALGNPISPTPVTTLVFAARELQTGTLSPSQSVTVTQGDLSYVEFKPECGGDAGSRCFTCAS